MRSAPRSRTAPLRPCFCSLCALCAVSACLRSGTGVELLMVGSEIVEADRARGEGPRQMSKCATCQCGQSPALALRGSGLKSDRQVIRRQPRPVHTVRRLPRAALAASYQASRACSRCAGAG